MPGMTSFDKFITDYADTAGNFSQALLAKICTDNNFLNGLVFLCKGDCTETGNKQGKKAIN